jgi:hypothetical protein
MSSETDPTDPLESVEQQIESARRDAEDAGLLPEADVSEGEQRYVESGDEQSEALDDQTITPG